MKTLYSIAVLFLSLSLLLWAPSVIAQNDVEADPYAADDPDEDSGDVTEDEEDYDYEDEEEAEEEAEEEGAELKLDFSALGDMDPEADLESFSVMTADQAASTAFAKDWTQRNLELLEVHGYFRVRPALFHKFYIRNDPSLFPMDAERKAGCTKSSKCTTSAQADMRLVLAPTLNVSEEVRVNTEMMFFNNLIMGSTPGYPVDPGAGTVATGAMLGHTQAPPSNDLFVMRRAWGEMESALGHLRFGRMPSHWGTGMMYNSGDGLNDNHGDTVDRISFAFKLNSWIIMPAFDFPNEGLSLNTASGRPFDVSQLDDAYRLVAILAYQHEEEDQRSMLKRGDYVINTGLHFSYRAQAMQFEWTEPSEPGYDSAIPNQITTWQRSMWGLSPNLWFQLLYDTFHFEVEVGFQTGRIGKPSNTAIDMDPMSIFSWGAVAQIDYGLLSDQLRLGLEFGIASGDRDVEGLSAPGSFDQPNGESSRYSVFSFNPAYQVDLILYRHILGTVAGSYYFKPWLRYDFLKSSMGKNLGVQLDVIFSRAFYQASTISNSSSNLGVELDARVDFATSDNFVASLAYGVLFPLNGFKGTYEWIDGAGATRSYRDTDLTIPQTLQLLMAIRF